MPATPARRPAIIAAALAATVLLLAACSGPAVFDGSRAPSSRSTDAGGAVVPGPGDRVHRVADGDTVYAVARQYGLSTRDIIDANRLQPPYRLEPGQTLVVPGQRLHVVERGDTVYAISRRYNVDMASLARLNGMGPPYTIYVGQRLRLPTPAGTAQVAAVEGTIGGQRVTLQRDVPAATGGQTPVSTAPLPEPSDESGAPSPEPSGSPDGTAGTSPPPAEVASLPPPVDYGVGQPKTKPPAPARSGPVPPPPPSTGRFIWPVEGRVTETFGAKAGGLHNDGLNIAAPRGAPVRAVDNGVVAYAGDRIRGFGQMVLLKHSNGLITAYAHNDALLVARGDVVNRGQVIARVGSSGGVPAPQLHFEVRKGTVAVDPAQYLPG